MLEEINPLPSAKHQPPRCHGNRELRLRERGSDMRRHVVQAFGAMDIALAIFRRDLLEKPFQIRPDIRAGVLLNQERGGGMAAENREQTSRDLFASNPGGQLLCNLDKAFALGWNKQAMDCLTHRTSDGIARIAWRCQGGTSLLNAPPPSRVSWRLISRALSSGGSTIAS